MVSGEGNMERRVSVLEAKMEWSSNTVHNIERDLEILKQDHFRIFERFSLVEEKIADLRGRMETRFAEFQMHYDKKFSNIEEKIFGMGERFFEFRAAVDERFAETDEKIAELRSHTDERFNILETRTDERFIRVYEEFASVHRAIATQTRWILVAVLGGATLIATLSAFLQPLANRVIGV